MLHARRRSSRISLDTRRGRTLRNQTTMQTNLFVRNISYKAQSEDLQALFEQVGTVTSAKVIFDKETGKSRGFGFVEMASTEEAERAIAELDGAELLDRAIAVQPAKPRE